MITLAGCASSSGTDTGTGGAPATGGAAGKGGTTGTGGSATGGSSGRSGEVPGGSGGTDPGSAGTGAGGSGASAGAGGEPGNAGMAGGAGTIGAAGSGQAGTTGTGGAVTGGGGAPHVMPQNATSIPATFGTPIANPGTWTGKTYQAYYYNANGSAADVFKPPVEQSTPMTKPVNIYTPPGYDPKTEYPYIVVLHGYGNNEDRFYELSEPNLVPFFDNLITSKATKPFIAVFPNGTVGGASNANGYYNFGGELMNDLIPFLEANYRSRKIGVRVRWPGFRLAECKPSPSAFAPI